MKLRTLICLMLLSLSSVGLAHADLDVYLEELTVAAHGDLGDFTAQLGARFGLSHGEIEVVLSNVDRPADAALVLWLGERSHQPRERVLKAYREEKGQGWGALAKRLGIKPGSDDFHALKGGNLDFHPSHRDGNHDHEHGKKSKDHGKSAKHK